MKSIVLVFLVFYTCNCQAQNAEEIAVKLANRLSDFSASAADPSDLILLINDWIQHPIPLNTCSLSDLEPFFFLSLSEKLALLEHRKQYGPFISKFELQAVKGIDLETAELLSWFVSIEETRMSDQLGLIKLRKLVQSEIIVQESRTQPKPNDFTKINTYAGSPDHISIRYRAQAAGRLWYGFSLEKDPGEAWGFLGDFQSFHFLLNRKGLVKTIALGDYQAGFGMGLNFGNTYFPGKSAAVFQTAPPASGFRPSRSLNEVGYLRGLAYSIGGRRWQMDQWFSLTPGSTTAKFTEEENDRLLPLSTSGLHRTPTELSRKNNIRSFVTGFHLQYRWTDKKAGLIWSGSRVVPGNVISDLQGPGWNQNQNFGFYFSGNFHRFQYQTEFSKTLNQGMAGLFQVLFPIDGKTDLLLLSRSFEPNYHNPYSNAWSHYSTIENEKGIYVGFQHKPNKKWLWLGYSDFFHSPLPRYLCSFPSVGKDHLAEVQFQIQRNHLLRLRGRYLDYQRNNRETIQVQSLTTEWKAQLRLDITLEKNGMNSHFRSEYNWGKTATGKSAEGILVFQDFHWKAGRSQQWNFKMRLLAFRSNDYLVRSYAPVPDFPPGGAQGMYSGAGSRWAALVQYRLSKNSNLGFRYGYGLDETEYNDSSYPTTVSDWKIQYRLRW